MSRQNIPGWARTLANWRAAARATEPLDTLPVVQLDPVMTDDDVDFWSDMMHLRNLLDSIHEQCIHTWPDNLHPAINPTMSATLDVALTLVREDFPSVEEMRALVATRVFGAL